jgi:hypothetical protein
MRLLARQAFFNDPRLISRIDLARKLAPHKDGTLALWLPGFPKPRIRVYQNPTPPNPSEAGSPKAARFYYSKPEMQKQQQGKAESQADDHNLEVASRNSRTNR